MRARRSAMGSVMVVFLPARLHETRDLALERQATEAQAAHLELAHVSLAAAADGAAVLLADLELLFPRGHLTETSHGPYSRFSGCLNGIPRRRSRARPSSSVLAVVTMVMFMPLILSIF